MMEPHFTAEEIEELAGGEGSGSDDHLADCARCANAVLHTLQVKRAIRDAMTTGPAPAALRRRVWVGEDARPSRSPVWWLVAAMLVVAALLSPFVWRGESSPALPELIDMHVTMLAGASPVDVLSTDRHAVKPWFEGRVPFGVPVPDLSGTAFKLIGGRVVYWHGSQAAYLLVGKGAHRISVFLLRPQDSPVRLGTAPSTFSASMWQDRGLTFIALADIPQADLEQLRDAFRRR